jgi:hypothetical protein
MRRHSYLLDHYVLRQNDGSQWEANWPTDHTFNGYCADGDTLSVGAYYKTVIGVCYERNVQPPDPALGVGRLPYMATSAGNGMYCYYPLLLDRISFDDFSDPANIDSYSGIGVIALDESPSPPEDIVYVRCFDPLAGPPAVLFPTYGMFGPASVDETGPVVVVHSLLW